MGLGDVYLGAPVATPLDPRHRLVTTKYNPARTWTPENAVGIGGAYLCIYGMEGPGGYQLFGRTLQVWNTFKVTREFEPGMPWLLRHFDQIRFFPVDAAQLMAMRDAFPHGGVQVEIEQTEFRYSDYLAFLNSVAAEVENARRRQQEAFTEERARWAATGQATYEPRDDGSGDSFVDNSVPEGCMSVNSPLSSSVWKVLVEPGQRVKAGDGLLVLEAMKTETLVAAPASGTVEEVRARVDTLVMQGQSLVILRQLRRD
jgi:urea carboxylase